MRSTLGAIALIGIVLAAPTVIALAAVTADSNSTRSYFVEDEPGSEYHGPENFWSD